MTIAQLDEMYGKKKPASQRNTRKQKEKNIDEYQKLVVEDESDNIAKFYASDYRGRVQNRNVDITPQPLYVLSFHISSNEVIQYKEFATFVEHLNSSGLFEHRLYITARESSVTEKDIQDIDQEAQRLTQEIGLSNASTAQLFALALLSSLKRDYSSALQSLDQSLQLDSVNQAALFLRATVKARILEAEQLSNSQLSAADCRFDQGHRTRTSLRLLLLQPRMSELQSPIHRKGAVGLQQSNRTAP